MTKDELIKFYMNLLGSDWQKWGLEIVESARRAEKIDPNDPRMHDYFSYISKILFNQIRKSFVKDGIWASKLADEIEQSKDENELLHLLKVDVEKDLGQDIYVMALAKYGEGLTLNQLSTNFNISIDSVRWKLSKLDRYIKERWTKNV